MPPSGCEPGRAIAHQRRETHLMADSSARVATSASGLSWAELPLEYLPGLAAQDACSGGRCRMLACCLALASGATARPLRVCMMLAQRMPAGAAGSGMDVLPIGPLAAEARRRPQLGCREAARLSRLALPVLGHGKSFTPLHAPESPSGDRHTQGEAVPGSAAASAGEVPDDQHGEF